ncbi:hypothetical protein [Olsenella uli]|uniref:hypothetical protein n=1 Tax=Olsenella uli TaxID=133926 RepID=UPI0012AB4F1E|nr:hypothetical protein [Olsenella uli]
MAQIKKGPALIANGLGVIIAIVGLVVTVMCSTMSADYALGSLGLYVAEIVAAAVLALVAAWAGSERGIVSLVASAVSVFLLVNVAVSVIGSRILLASGLFTWNSANQVGWGVFNTTIAATALLLVAALVIVVAAFLPEGKKKTA